MHDGRPLTPHVLWTAWSFEPAVVIGLALTGFLYLFGLRRLWHNAGSGHGVRYREALFFALGWAGLAVALISPLHQMGEALFSAHMAQHELLMVLAAPLLVLGRPIVAFLWSVPISWRRSAGSLSLHSSVQRTWHLLTLPAVAWTIHAIAIWLWHVPALFQATLDSNLIHTAQHLSFLGSALLFWWSLLRVREGRLGRPAAILYLFTTALHTSLLGVLLTFSDRVWYPLYQSSTAPWGLTPLEDQQLAGLIMWIPGGVAYLVAALAIAASWLRESGRGVAIPARAGATGVVAVMLAALTLAGCKRSTAMTPAAATQITGGIPQRGALAIRQYGCGTCHTIPGIPGARATVGPALAGISGRPYIAGVLTNTPTNLIRWIHHPQQIDSLTAMPDVGLTEPVARDIVSYLYTLK
ncbi:MAG: cytochrome c oxidase assembly protein [Gemmatimonadales bacterium]